MYFKNAKESRWKGNEWTNQISLSDSENAENWEWQNLTETTIELATPNKRGRSHKWSQMNPSKTSEHKDANEN